MTKLKRRNTKLKRTKFYFFSVGIFLEQRPALYLILLYFCMLDHKLLCQIRDINSNCRGKPCPQTGATNYHAQLGLN